VWRRRGYLGLPVGAGGQQVVPLGLFGHQLEAVQHRRFAQAAGESRAALEGRSTRRAGGVKTGALAPPLS